MSDTNIIIAIPTRTGHPTRFHCNPVPNREYQYDFFQTGVKDLDYLPEDFFFFDAARELGFDIWIIPWRERDTPAFTITCSIYRPSRP